MHGEEQIARGCASELSFGGVGWWMQQWMPVTFLIVRTMQAAGWRPAIVVGTCRWATWADSSLHD